MTTLLTFGIASNKRGMGFTSSMRLLCGLNTNESGVFLSLGSNISVIEGLLKLFSTTEFVCKRDSLISYASLSLIAVQER